MMLNRYSGKTQDVPPFDDPFYELVLNDLSASWGEKSSGSFSHSPNQSSKSVSKYADPAAK